MDNETHSLSRTESPRPNTQRQRSNSFPFGEALGCSTPEAQLLLAEGRAAVRKRRTRGRRNRSFNDESITTFDPREHLKYLDSLPTLERTTTEPPSSDWRHCHARIPSNVTDRSTSTVVPHSRDGEASPPGPLGDYSANLAQFIKAQLQSIPTYQPNDDPTAPLSPRSCPDFSFPVRESSQRSTETSRRLVDAPTSIEMPAVRPPMKSAFSAWSSTDNSDTDDDELSLPDVERYTNQFVSKFSSDTPSVLGYYANSNNSFLYSSSPAEEERPDTAKASTFPEQSSPPDSPTEFPEEHDGSSSSSLLRPMLTTSAPSPTSSSLSGSSYFDCKRPNAPQLRNRIIAALTPPHGKTLAATSPWEGGAVANVHDVYIETQQRVHVDGMSFDMVRDFTFPGRVSTPC
jgi:hypothetical protein